jgi:RNA polymerase sigma-70 factor (ECF subfamily)
MTIQATQAMHKAVEHLTDTELIEAVGAGDMRALEALMRRHNRTLYRTARAILGDDAEAEDAVQEAYLRAYRGLAGFRGEAKLSTWLVRIVANEALMRRRRRARTAAVVPLDATAASTEEWNSLMSDRPGPEQDASRAEMRRMIEARIDGLPDSYRAVFVLRALEELSVEETAGVLQIPEATVRTRFFRARALLREGLAREVDRGLEEAFGFAGERCDRIVANVLAAVKRSAA